MKKRPDQYYFISNYTPLLSPMYRNYVNANTDLEYITITKPANCGKSTVELSKDQKEIILMKSIQCGRKWLLKEAEIDQH